MFHFSGYQHFLPPSSSIKTPNLKPAFDAKELETVDMEAITDVQFSSTDRLVTCDRPVSLNYPGSRLEFQVAVRLKGLPLSSQCPLTADLNNFRLAINRAL